MLLALDGEESFEVDAELKAVLLESIAQADRGETIPAEELARLTSRVGEQGSSRADGVGVIFVWHRHDTYFRSAILLYSSLQRRPTWFTLAASFSHSLRGQFGRGHVFRA